MNTGLKILLGLGALGVAYAVVSSRKDPALPGGASTPTMPPRGGGLESVPTIRNLNSDSPQGSSPAAVGDLLRMQGPFPSGFDVTAQPLSALKQLSSNDFQFQAPGVASITWNKSGTTRTVTFNIA